MMTSSRYSNDVVLRWAQLCARAQEEPVKKLHHRLRKVHEWPTCAQYEEVFGMGTETPLGIPMPEKKSCAGRPSSDGRKKSSKHRRSKGDERRAHSSKNAESRASVSSRDTVVGRRAQDLVVYGTGGSIRNYKRALNNNRYIDRRTAELENQLAKVKLTRESTSSEASRDSQTKTIRGLSQGISRLQGERSDVPSAPGRMVPAYPPPVSLSSSSSVGFSMCSHSGYHTLCPTCSTCVRSQSARTCCVQYGRRRGIIAPPGHPSGVPFVPSSGGNGYSYLASRVQANSGQVPSGKVYSCDCCGGPWAGTHLTFSTRQACLGPSQKMRDWHVEKLRRDQDAKHHKRRR